MSPTLLAGLAFLIGVAVGAGALLILRRRRAPAPASVEPDEHTRRLAATGARLAAVAHELGSPLTAILAFADDLLHTDPSREQREALLVIRHQARRTRLLVRGLLDSLREQGGGEPEGPSSREPVRVDVLAQGVARVFERQCAARGLRFECSLGPDLPLLSVNPLELEQVLSNLLENACQATPEGGAVTLTVQVRGRLLEFVVRDNGGGIPEDAMPHLFEPFFTTKHPGAGTGLGLSVSQGIIRRYRGILSAENVPAVDGGGARFVVSLPFDDRRWRDRDLAPDELEPAATGTGTTGAGRRALLVEDEEPVRMAVRRFLERRGWLVDEARDGRAALAALLLGEAAGADYDAVICDLRLPGISGIAVYERMEAERPEVALRMILVTGDARAADVTALRDRVGARLLEKPFELSVLGTVLDRLVRFTG